MQKPNLSWQRNVLASAPAGITKCKQQTYLPGVLLLEGLLEGGLSRRQVPSRVHHVHSVGHIHNRSSTLPGALFFFTAAVLSCCNSCRACHRRGSVDPTDVVLPASETDQDMFLNMCGVYTVFVGGICR